MLKEKVLKNSNPPVIVLSRNYSTGLGVIRSLGAEGYKVNLIASVKKRGSSIIASSSKYVQGSVEILTEKIQGDSGSELIDVLLEYAKTYKDKIVLFPVDDFTASIVDSNRNILKECFLMPKITEKSELSLVEAMDKTLQSRMAKKAGLLTPLEWIISLSGDINIPNDIVYPCFVKPLQSISGSKKEMTICNSETDLKNHLLNMKVFYDDRDVLVQEYLDIDKEYALSGVCNDQDIIIPGIIEKTKTACYECGVAISGKMLSIDILGKLKDKIECMLREFHYIGMFDMDLILCNNKIYFSEVNLRSGGTNYAYFLNGVNLPDIFVKAITGEKNIIRNNEIKNFGKTFVYEKVAWEDYIHSFITKNELKEYIEKADFSLLTNENDPKPGKYFNRKIRLSALKHKFKEGKKNIFLHQIPKDSFNSEAEKPMIVVTGRNYGNILTIVRDFGKVGYEVSVMRVFKEKPHVINLLRKMRPESLSKYVKKYCECIAHNDSRNVVKNLIELSDSKRKMILIPVDDYTVSVVDNAFDILSSYYLIPNINNKTGEINRLMDKQQQKKLAAEFNLPVLQGVLIKAINGKFVVPPNIKFPCFIKPNISMKSNKAKITKCSNYEELLKTLTQYAKTEDFEMLVEEFADIKAEYSILGLSTKEAAIAPGLFKTIEGGHKERKGVALTGKVIPCINFQSFIDKCCEFINSIGYTGLFDVDLIETNSGEIYFVELNFRAGASSHVLTELGVNLPRMLAEYLIENKLHNEIIIIKNTNISFVNEKILLEEYARGDINLSKIKRIMKLSDVCFIKDEQDLKVYRYFKRFYFIAALMRVYYRIKY